MATKLSQQLMDAHMVGDREEIDRINAEINNKYEQSKPKVKTNTVKINTVFNKDDSSAISIYDFLNKTLGQDWWEWEIETVEKMLWTKYGIVLKDSNRDKLLAIRHVCVSDRSFHDWFEFNQVCLSFCGFVADFEMLRSPSPGMVISTLKSLNHIRPDRNSEFGDDVLKYICIILKDDGIYAPPPSIAHFIQSKMEEFISSETKNKWLEIYAKYKDILDNGSSVSGETEIDIQAKRLIRAEQSAINYGVK